MVSVNGVHKNELQNIIVIDISDDDDDKDMKEKFCCSSEQQHDVTATKEPLPQHHHQDKIALFVSILPQYQANDAIRYLSHAKWNTDDAIDSALLDPNRFKNENKNNNKDHDSAISHIDNDADVVSTTDDGMIDLTTSLILMKNNDTVAVTHRKRQRIESEHQYLNEKNGQRQQQEHYIDSEFPPSSQSLNGRSSISDQNNVQQDQQRSQESQSIPVITKCYCGCRATPKQVQSDGPNYGRFYLSCGFGQQQQQQQRSRQSKNDTENSNKKAVKTKEHNDKDDERQNTAAKETQPSTSSDVAVIRNPYVSSSKRNNAASATISNPISTDRINSDMVGPCQFFQWDTTGVLGSTILHDQYQNDHPDRTNNRQQQRHHLQHLISWCRFGFEQQCVLYHKQASVHDIRQGRVGNCWFLSALSVVAEQSHLIQRILSSHTSLNTVGCYKVQLFLDGKWQTITIDSYLPVLYQPINNNSSKKSKINTNNAYRHGIPVQIHQKQHHDQSSSTNFVSLSDSSPYLALPAFCATPDRQLWAAFIEKAYAKAHGSYQQLSGGYIAEGFQDLTGAPCETYIFDTDVLFASSEQMMDMFWMKLLSFHTAGYIMGVATSTGGDGLVGGHAYSILDVIDIPNAIIGEQSKVTDYFTTSTKVASSNDTINDVNDKQGFLNNSPSIRLIRIRNPWGKREWKGDWSVSSERWTNKLRKRLGIDTTYAKGDGTFYMSFQDMLERFHHLDVAKTQKGWLHSSVNGIFLCDSDPILSSKYVYQLSVSQTTQVYISIIQPKKRSHTKNQYWYCDPSMIILRQVRNDETDRQLESVATSLNGVTRQCHIEIFLKAGEMYYCVPWSFTAQCDHSFRIVTYSGSAVAIKSIPVKDNDTDNCISQSFIRKCALRALHSELIMSNDGNNVYPIIGPNRNNGVLLGNYGGNQYSFYILAINGSPDHYLSLRFASNNINDSQFIVSSLNRPGKPFNSDHQDFDIPPLSQKLLFVVTSTGTKKRGATQKNPSFRYFSSWVVQKQTNSIVTRPSTSCKISFGGSMTICPVGQRSLMLHCCVDSAQDRPGCNGSIETSFESVSMLLGHVAMPVQ